MLILTRRIGERIMVSTPIGILWITMDMGHATCNDGRGEMTVSPDSGPLVYYYDADELVIVFKPRKVPRHNDGIGITAPRDWVILREELMDRPEPQPMRNNP